MESKGLRPTSQQFERELKRRKRKREFLRTIWGQIQFVLVFLAVAVLLTTLLFPVFQVERHSMMPTLQDGDVLVCFTVGEIRKGDVVALHYNNEILIRRVIAGAGESVVIDSEGAVSVDGAVIDEPYVLSPSLEPCTIDFPLVISGDHYFVLGDNRAVSADSRDSKIVTISRDHIIGKAILRVWPLARFGFVG